MAMDRAWPGTRADDCSVPPRPEAPGQELGSKLPGLAGEECRDRDTRQARCAILRHAGSRSGPGHPPAKRSGRTESFFFAPSADPTNAPGRRRIGFQFGNPAIDRATRDTRRLLDYIGPSKAVGARLSRHEKSPSSFVENRQHIRVSFLDGLDHVEGAIHSWILTRPIPAVNPQNAPGPSFPKSVAIRFTYFLTRT